MNSNIIKATRSELGLTQTEFGEWLAKKIDKIEPIPDYRISEWERGIRSPRKNVRKACMPIVASAIATKATVEISKVFEDHDIKVPYIKMSDEMKAVEKKVQERIVNDTS